MRAATLAAAGLALCACSAPYHPTREGCLAQPGNHVEGSPADFHPPAGDAGFAVEGPSPCGADAGVFLVVAGAGPARFSDSDPFLASLDLPDGGRYCERPDTSGPPCTELSGRVFDVDLLGSLRDAGVEPEAPDEPVGCVGSAFRLLFVPDWRRMDAAVGAIGRVEGAWGVDARVGIIVRNEVHICPL